jgi:hypothetical protein
MDLPSQIESFPFGSSPEFLDSLEYHRAHPGTSVAEYRSLVRSRLAARALSRHRLYIDTSHWTHLRDAYLGRARDPQYIELLRLLESLVEANRLIVPLSDQLVEETCHQADPQTRRATAEIIDRLTGGVTLLGWKTRKLQEVRHWVSSLLEGHSAVPLDSVWVTVYHAFGILDFKPTFPDQELVAAFLKSAEDLASRVGLRVVIDNLGHSAGAVMGRRNLADELTGYKATIWSNQRSFKEIFQEEALSYLDRVLTDVSPEVLEELKRLPHGKELEGSWIVGNVKRAFLACEQLELHPNSLPGLRIIAGGHSRIRADQGRKFKPGDGADLFHAAAALPYCNAFLTDRSMRHLLTTPPTDFAGLYGCTVLSTPAEAAQYLTCLAAA